MKIFTGLVAKTFIALTLVITSVMGIYAAYQIVKSSKKLEDNWRQLHEVNILSNVPSLGLALWGMYKDSARTGLQSAFDYGEISRIQLYDDQGKTFVAVQRLPDGKIDGFEGTDLSEEARNAIVERVGDLTEATEKTLPEMPIIRKAVEFQHDLLTGIHTITLPVLSYQSNKLQIVGFIITEYTSNHVRQQILDQKENIILLSCGLIGTLLCLSFLFMQVAIIRPISSIAKTSLAVAGGNFERIKNIKNRDEIGILANNFNYMLSEIEESTKNLNALVHHGKAIASQFTLQEIDSHIRDTLLTFLPSSNETSVLFSQHCFVDSTLDKGFYASSETGEPIKDTFVPAAKVEQLEGNLFFVTDPKTEMRLAVIQVKSGQIKQQKRIEDNLKMVAVHVGSALSTVRLEQTFSQLASKTTAIRIIFENVNQGIFTLAGEQTIDNEYSRALEEILEAKDLGGKHISEVIFSQSNLSQDQISMVTSLVELSVGENTLNFEYNSHNLPTEITFKGRKTLEMEWTPITLEDGFTIKHLMVTLRDVTNLRLLQEESKKAREENEFIVQIVNQKRSKFNNFIQFVDQVFATSKKLLNQPNVTQNDLAAVKRELHTVKGNARLLGFKGVAEVTHEQEGVFVALEANLDSKADKEHTYRDMLNCVIAVKAMADRYAEVAKTKLGSQDEITREKLLGSLFAELETLMSQNDSVFRKTAVPTLIANLASAEGQSFAKLFAEIEIMLAQSSKLADRELVTLDAKLEKDWTLKAEISAALLNCFMHLSNNSMDHGLAKKAGTIEISSAEETNQVTVYFSDTGRGLALGRIREKGMSTGLLTEMQNPTDADVASLIFESGLSTSQTLSDTSGRGVGMDAVKSSLEKLGASISIEFTSPRDDEGFRKFRFAIALPRAVLGNPSFVPEKYRNKKPQVELRSA